MIALLLTVFVASILGSLHCAGMCGPFAWLAASNESGLRKSQWPALAGYHGSRLILYSILGVIAGTVGFMVDLGSTAAGIQRGAAWLGGISMIVYALMRLAGSNRRLVGGSFVSRITSPLTKWLALARSMKGWQRAALIGAVSSLMPCGWLYAFVLAAAGTGSPLWGAALMVAFWVGTVPILVMVVLGMGHVAEPIAARVPVMVAIAVLSIGFYTVTMRSTIDLSGRVPAVAIQKSADYVRGIDQEKLPCCSGVAEQE